MKNFPVNVEGKEYWISRSCAVVGIVYKKDENGNYFILANKRGKGCPDYVGYWNIPCGYLDYDETISQAVHREIHEETGLDVPNSKWNLWFISSLPTDEKQTVSFRFICEFEESFGSFTTKYSETNEVDEIKWIPFDEVDEYEWAFNQKWVVDSFIYTMRKTKLHEKIHNGEQIEVLFS